MIEKTKRIGEKHVSTQGQRYEIVEYFNFKNCTIQFEDGTTFYNKRYDHVSRGKIKNPILPSIYGVGFLGIGEFKSYTKGETTHYYSIWKDMVERCYSTKQREKQPTYYNVTICNEWHNFQNFAKWFEENYNPETMQGWHLDKDILIKGNKIYSPETCSFVPNEINILFCKANNIRGIYPIGVSSDRQGIFAQICLGRGTRKFLGYFKTPEEAFEAYKTAKEHHIKKVADLWRGLISENVYEAMYAYEVEITD